jgi:pyruvate dehydrogenase E1 component alpha subunit
VDGTDVLTVYREGKRAIEQARDGGGPSLLELVTLRMEGHAVHDDASYVPRALFEEFQAKDPVDRFRAWLQVNHELGEDEERRISDEVRATIDDAVERAEASPAPDPASVMDGVYAE